MTTIVDDLQSYQNRRRFPNWQPRQPESAYVRGTHDELIHRCLHFLPLELQVQDWCNSANFSIPPSVSEFLRRNAKDELKHDSVLKMLADYYNTGEPPVVAKALMQRWQALDCHPVLSAYTLEIGVFFTILPTLIKYGDVYAATVAQWINDDERCHVETNLRIVRELKLKVTEDLARLVFETVAYIYQPLGATMAKTQAERAVKRLITGKDKQMLVDSLPITVAYFEQVDKRAIVY